MKAVVLFSGGLDSTVLAYQLLAEGADLRLLSVHYGQRHQRELNDASRLAESMRVPTASWNSPNWGASWEAAL